MTPLAAQQTGHLPVAAEALQPRETSAGGYCDFESLVRRFGPPLLGYIRQRVPGVHEAEDLLQETFLRAYRHRGRLDESRPPGPWLFSIARHLVTSHLRSRHAAVRVLPEERADPTQAEPAELIGRQEQADSLWALAKRVLPEAYFTALWLRYAAEMPVRQVALALGKTVIGTKVLLHRARRRLSEHLGPGTGEPLQ